VFYNKEFAKQIGIAFFITLLLAFWRFTKKTILLIFNHEKSFWLTKPTFYDLKSTVYDFFNGKEIFFFYLILIFTVFIIIYFNKSTLLKEFITIKPLYIILCSIGVISICFAISSITPIFTKRYVVYALPFMCILIGFITSAINNAKLKYTAIGLICIMSIYSFSKIDFHTIKPMDYKNAMVFVKKEQTPNTAILVESRDVRDLFNYYYDKTIFTDLKNMNEKLQSNSIFIVSNAGDVKAIDFTKYSKVILTQTFVKQGAENDSLLKAISTNYKTETANKNYKGVDILVFSN
jgi:hypothetical protein